MMICISKNCRLMNMHLKKGLLMKLSKKGSLMRILKEGKLWKFLLKNFVKRKSKKNKKYLLNLVGVLNLFQKELLSLIMATALFIISKRHLSLNMLNMAIDSSLYSHRHLSQNMYLMNTIGALNLLPKKLLSL
jgi:hypothetical protein